MIEIPLVTSETNLAVYLIQQGFKLLEIQYEPRSNGNRKRGIFLFSTSDKRIYEFRDIFNNGNASINMADFEEIRKELVNRILKEQP